MTTLEEERGEESENERGRGGDDWWGESEREGGEGRWEAKADRKKVREGGEGKVWEAAIDEGRVRERKDGRRDSREWESERGRMGGGGGRD